MEYDDILKVWTKREQELEAEVRALKTKCDELIAANADEEVIDNAQCDHAYLEHKLNGLKDAISILLSTHSDRVVI